MHEAPETDTELDAILAVYKRQLKKLATLLEAAIDRVQADGDDAELEIGKTVSRLRDWLKATLDLEARVHAEQRKERASAGNYALDLVSARDEIRGRFYRLVRSGDD